MQRGLFSPETHTHTSINQAGISQCWGQRRWAHSSMNNAVSSGRGWGGGQVGGSGKQQADTPKRQLTQTTLCDTIRQLHHKHSHLLGQPWETQPSLTWGLLMGALVRQREGECAETILGPGRFSPKTGHSVRLCGLAASLELGRCEGQGLFPCARLMEQTQPLPFDP